MREIKRDEFVVKSLIEKGYIKVYISHSEFKGRVKKHVGKGSLTEFDNILTELRKDITKYFTGKLINYDTVHDYACAYVESLKNIASIFNYKDEFILSKRNKFNKKTKKYLSNSSINSYIRAIEEFRTFLKTNHLSELAEDIKESVLNDFFDFMNSHSHNYKVKIHSRAKEFISYLLYHKNLPIHISYANSCFTEEYDNQETEEEDRSLSISEMLKLIELREQFNKGMINLPPYKQVKTIPYSVQIIQRDTKLNNLKKTLDCFLFMCSSGLYLADVSNVKLTIKSNPRYSSMSYRRIKNNTFCTGIPLTDKGCFLGQTLIKEYEIKNGGNFPLKLSLNHFNKNLVILSTLAGFKFVITSKMARKTFASLYYFDYSLPLANIQKMLGHQDEKHTKHYLRITEDDLTSRNFELLEKAG